MIKVSYNESDTHIFVTVKAAERHLAGDGVPVAGQEPVHLSRQRIADTILKLPGQT